MAEQGGIRTKIIVGVTTGSILAAIGFFGKALWPIVWSGVTSAVASVWSWLCTGHAISGWTIVVLSLGSLISIVGAALFFSSGGEQPKQPDWRSYRADEFFGAVWRWEFPGGCIGSPVPFCARCDTQIIPREVDDFSHYLEKTMTFYNCDHCNYSIKLDGTFRENQDRVTRQIARLLRSGEWKTSKGAKPAEGGSK